MIEIDGSSGEGGGQILRTSLALALITGQAFHVRQIRARRPKPGLQPQHLMSVRAAAAIGQAQLRGASLGSSDLSFEPGEVLAGKYHFSIGTAGATGLVLHTICLPLACRTSSPSEVTLQGGTHVRTSPCFDFLQETWGRYLQAMGLHVTLRLIRPGFFPRGGGVLEAKIQPSPSIASLSLRQRSEVKTAGGFSAVAGLPGPIAQRQARRATHRLRQLGIRADLREESWPGGPGTVLAVVLDTQPVPSLFFGLGERGKPAERVADEAVDQVEAYLEAPSGAVDVHSADQIVLPLSLAPGATDFTVTEVTSHLLTNIGVIRQFLDRDIRCDGERGEPGHVHIAAATRQHE